MISRKKVTWSKFHGLTSNYSSLCNQSNGKRPLGHRPENPDRIDVPSLRHEAERDGRPNDCGCKEMYFAHLS